MAVIAIEGIDGVGKTTISMALAKRLGLGCPKTPVFGRIFFPVFGPGKIDKNPHPDWI